MNPLWTLIAEKAGRKLTDDQLSAMNRYLDLLLDANQRLNLTRITDRAQAEIQHVGDALTLLPFLPQGPISIADIGSGGGVPGIPLAIALPEAKVLLVESTRKKAGYLQQTITALGLTNAQVTDQRAEALGRGRQRETFDVVIARAVGAMNWLAEWCLPLAKKGGKVLAMKGGRITEELPAALKPIRLLGGGEPVVHPVELPGTDHHVIVEIQKIGKTDLKYPRNPTTTRGKPLT